MSYIYRFLLSIKCPYLNNITQETLITNLFYSTIIRYNIIYYILYLYEPNILIYYNLLPLNNNISDLIIDNNINIYYKIIKTLLLYDINNNIDIEFIKGLNYDQINNYIEYDHYNWFNIIISRFNIKFNFKSIPIFNISNNELLNYNDKENINIFTNEISKASDLFLKIAEDKSIWKFEQKLWPSDIPSSLNMHKSRIQAHDQGNVRNFAQSFYTVDKNLQSFNNLDMFKDTKDLNSKIEELTKIKERKAAVYESYKSQLEEYSKCPTLQSVDLNEIKGKLNNIAKSMKELEGVSTKWSQKWLYQWKSRGSKNNEVNDWDDSTAVEFGKIAIQVKEDLGTSEKLSKQINKINSVSNSLNVPQISEEVTRLTNCGFDQKFIDKFSNLIDGQKVAIKNRKAANPKSPGLKSSLKKSNRLKSPIK